MSAHYERYPASSEAIRGIARRANGSATSINDLKGSVESAHRAALSEAAGDVNEAMQPAMAPFKGDASQVTRAAIWASCQLEEFADAIDVYDDTSSDPRSISKLNSAYENLDGDPLARACAPSTARRGGSTNRSTTPQPTSLPASGANPLKRDHQGVRSRQPSCRGRDGLARCRPKTHRSPVQRPEYRRDCGRPQPSRR